MPQPFERGGFLAQTVEVPLREVPRLRLGIYRHHGRD